MDRAMLWKDSGEVDRAQEEVLRYLSAQPEDTRARILLADIHAKQGHLRQAAQTLIEVLETSPEDRDASYRLAQLYRELGEPQKAIETMEGLINTLERSTDPADMEALARAMEEYEKAIAEHEKDFRDERDNAIRKLRELSVDTVSQEKKKPDDDSLMMEDMEPLEEEAVPIINVGGLEPVFAVREVDEELKLEEVDESIQEDAVSIEDERPPNLVNLLKDQELYEENPALSMFEPHPCFSCPAQRSAGPGPFSTSTAGPRPGRPGFPARAALTLPAGGIGARQFPEGIGGRSVEGRRQAVRRDEGALPQSRREEGGPAATHASHRREHAAARGSADRVAASRRDGPAHPRPPAGRLSPLRHGRYRGCGGRGRGTGGTRACGRACDIGSCPPPARSRQTGTCRPDRRSRPQRPIPADRRVSLDRRAPVESPAPADRRVSPDRRSRPRAHSCGSPRELGSSRPTCAARSRAHRAPADRDDAEVTLEEVAEELEPVEEIGEAEPELEPAPAPKGWPGP